jgi:hypothetical protein
MNGAFGDGAKWFSPSTPGGGDWSAFYNPLKLSAIHSPGPADCWVITDEHPNSNDDATLYVNPADANSTVAATSSFTELPGSLHGNSSGEVFADGHSDLHKWTGSITTTKFQPGRTSYLQVVPVAGDTASINDLVWFAMHTPAN